MQKPQMDMKINLPTLLTLVTAAGGLFMYFGALENRTTVLERQVEQSIAEIQAIDQMTRGLSERGGRRDERLTFLVSSLDEIKISQRENNRLLRQLLQQQNGGAR